ncbi:MAG: hypothetical protein IIB77_05790 [Proteobacteria bacterium]|nr:hypothetical protein [Pseudomonadota bacterium]
MKKELNCVPILLRLMQKGVYSSYTPLLLMLLEKYRLGQTRPISMPFVELILSFQL